jgi:hypothetical protein
MAFFAANITAWFVPFRMTVGAAPLHKPLKPSSLTMVTAPCTGPLYFSSSFASPCCCCNRILTTSNGVTITSASITPAPNPAAILRAFESSPVSASLSALVNTAFVPMRSAYFSVRCVANGVSPFHSARTPSSLTIVDPHCQIPVYFPARSSCNRVLMTSIGWRQVASTIPPRDPEAAFTQGGLRRFSRFFASSKSIAGVGISGTAHPSLNPSVTQP